MRKLSTNAFLIISINIYVGNPSIQYRNAPAFHSVGICIVHICVVHYFGLNIYALVDESDEYNLFCGSGSLNRTILKWAWNSRARPSITIGVPSSEQINSPVIFGDHVIVAANRG